MATLFIGPIFFLVTATVNVSLLSIHGTTSCPSSTTDFCGILLEKNSFKSNPYFIWQLTTWRTKRLLVIVKVRRKQHACALYCYSTLTFRLLLKLIFDIELNLGPNISSNCAVKANTRNTNNKDYSPQCLPRWIAGITFCLLKRIFYQTNLSCLLYLKLG